MRITPVPGSAGPNPIYSFALSQDQIKIVFSGKYRPADEMGCGLFELLLPDGKIRKVVDNPGCESTGFQSGWRSISLSPDGKKAVAIGGGRQARLQLIDLADAATKELGEGFYGRNGRRMENGSPLSRTEEASHYLDRRR